MQYVADRLEMKIGDQVIVEGNVAGRIVCDYDSQSCLAGYETWLDTQQLADGSKLISGVMIETEELGFLHFAHPDPGIVRAEAT